MGLIIMKFSGDIFICDISIRSNLPTKLFFYSCCLFEFPIGLADPQAVAIALSALDAVQLVGMPESDCIIAQCAVYLARAPKSREVISFKA